MDWRGANRSSSIDFGFRYSGSVSCLPNPSENRGGLGTELLVQDTLRRHRQHGGNCPKSSDRGMPVRPS